MLVFSGSRECAGYLRECWFLENWNFVVYLLTCLFLEFFSAREISKGDEVAWYADGDHTVRNEYNPDIAYSFG